MFGRRGFFGSLAAGIAVLLPGVYAALPTDPEPENEIPPQCDPLDEHVVGSCEAALEVLRKEEHGEIKEVVVQVLVVGENSLTQVRVQSPCTFEPRVVHATRTVQGFKPIEHMEVELCVMPPAVTGATTPEELMAAANIATAQLMQCTEAQRSVELRRLANTNPVLLALVKANLEDIRDKARSN